MFTGIITQLGIVKKRKETYFSFSADSLFLKKISTGTSVAVNGVCLTVLEKPKTNFFTVEVMSETEKKTNIGFLKEHDIVNLELPATPATFLSGHVVQGHVDGVSEILSITKEGNSHVFTFSLAKKLHKYLVEKGSITINGISLTVISVTSDSFTVGIIPHTLEHTMLHTSKVHDRVNVEVDVLAKYIEKLFEK